MFNLVWGIEIFVLVWVLKLCFYVKGLVWVGKVLVCSGFRRVWFVLGLGGFGLF